MHGTLPATGNTTRLYRRHTPQPPPRHAPTSTDGTPPTSTSARPTSTDGTPSTSTDDTPPTDGMPPTQADSRLGRRSGAARPFPAKSVGSGPRSRALGPLRGLPSFQLAGKGPTVPARPPSPIAARVGLILALTSVLQQMAPGNERRVALHAAADGVDVARLHATAYQPHHPACSPMHAEMRVPTGGWGVCVGQLEGGKSP